MSTHIKKLPLGQATAQALNRYAYPLITAYRLGVLVYKLCAAKEFEGQALRLTAPGPRRHNYSETLKFLTKLGVLEEAPGFPAATVFIVLGRSRTGSKELLPQETVCTVDPFAYVSHLSAMKYHGLTDRLPQSLYVSSPAPKDWRRFAEQKAEKDLGPLLSGYVEATFPKLVRHEFSRVFGVTVHLHRSLHLGAYKNVPDSAMRVATIGRTFLDMIRDPDLCGGIRHVLDVYRDNSAKYQQLILAEANRHGTPIDKVRLGYILEDVCGLHDVVLEEWIKFAQRGGSRKLYAKGEYRPTYSERWCLSLNVD